MKQKVYQALATSFQARLNCERSNNREWFERHTERIERLCRYYLPHGSGFDSGTKFDFEASKPDKLVLITAYHHMNENGMYDGWSDPIIVTVKPDWQGCKIRLSGVRRKNSEDADAFAEAFDYHLNEYVEEGKED